MSRGKPIHETKSAGGRTVPSETLIFLAHDGSNSMKWRKALHEYFGAEYGIIGHFLEDGAYYVRPAWDAAQWQQYQLLHGLTNVELSKHKSTKAQSHQTKIEEDVDNYSKMYARVMQTLMEDQKSLIKQQANWIAIRNARMPLELIELAQQTIVNQTAGLPIAEQLDTALRRYMDLKQYAWESADAYSERSQELVGQLLRLHHPSAPDEATAVRHAIHGLLSPKYDQYKINLLNETRSGVRQYPNTWGAMVTAVCQWINPIRSSTMPNRFVYQCNVCNKSGHEEPNCYVAHPELRPKNKKSSDTKSSSSTAPAAAIASAVGSKLPTAEGGVHNKGASSKKKKGKRRAGEHVTAYAASVVDDDENVRELWGFPTEIYCANASAVTARVVEDPRAISIDTFADLSFVHNACLLEDIRDAPFTVHGVSGSGQGQKMGQLACFGEAALITTAKVNALAAWQAQMFRNTVLPGVSWIIHLPSGVDLIFEWNDRCKSYTCIFSEEIIETLRGCNHTTNEHVIGGIAMSATLSELERSVPRKELLRARGARELQSRLYYPSDLALVRTLTSGSVLNTKVTGADVKLARDLLGPSESTLAGKSKNAGPVAPSEVLVPSFMRKEQTAYADIFYWREVVFLLFIIKPLYLLMVRVVPTGANNSEQLVIEILALCTKVKARGYKIVSLVVDPARALSKIAESGAVPGMTVVGAGGHVPDAEVEIRVVEERCRCMEASLSVPVPLRLVKWLVYGAVQSRNVVLRSHQTVTAREAFTGVKFDAKRDVRAKFLDYAQAFRTPEKSKDSEPRTVSAVYLMSTGNREGSVFMYDLTSERVFTCDRFTLLPMPELAVSKLIHLWTRDEPVSKRKRRAVWKLARGMRGVENLISENVIDEDRAISDVVVIPSARDPVSDVDYPVVDLLESGIIEEPIVQGTDALSAGVDNPGILPDSVEEFSVNTRGVEPLEPRLSGDVDPLEHVTGIEKEGDDFLPSASNSDDLRANEDETVLSVDPAVDAGDRRQSARRSARLASRRIDVYTLRAYRMSLNKALKLQKTSTREAVMKELDQILNKNVWTYVNYRDLSKTQIKKIIRSLMFLKEKVDAAGRFVKMKARLVAGGDGQDKAIYDNISSPTVCLESVMTILAIAATLRRKIATVDITGAYLECKLPDTDEVLMRLDPVVTRLLQEKDPSAIPFQLSDGTTVVKLKRALYGCVQSARLWFEKLRDTLESIGFVSNPYDLCVFNKIVDGHQCTICFHVDDLLITCGSDTVIDGIVKDLGKTFAGVSVTRGDIHSYLGMGITISTIGIFVDMNGYLKKIIEERAPTGRAATSPATENLLDHDDSAILLNEAEQKLFHSDVAKVLFIAKRVRMMTLTAVSVLASRVNVATHQDREKLDRVFSYLAYSRDIVMKFKCGGTVNFEVYVGASWATHMDGHGRTGIVIMMSGCAIAAWTSKQKMVTRSSTEAEIVALSDALSHVMWLRRWLAAQGHEIDATVVYQDNEAVMRLMRSDRRTHQRTKHLDVRYFYARDLESEGAIRLQWIPTADMLADLMTKPDTGALFEGLNARLMGYQ